MLSSNMVVDCDHLDCGGGVVLIPHSGRTDCDVCAWLAAEERHREKIQGLSCDGDSGYWLVPHNVIKSLGDIWPKTEDRSPSESLCVKLEHWKYSASREMKCCFTVTTSSSNILVLSSFSRLMAPSL